MNQNSVTITLDFKKARIRLYKSMLHLLGDPKYIQLLINPDEQMVCIRCLEYPSSNSQSYTLNHNRFHREDSIELYSSPLTSALQKILNTERGTYRMTGVVNETQRLAVFSMKTLQKVEGDA